MSTKNTPHLIPVSVNTKTACAITGLNKNILIKTMQGVGVFRFKAAGSSYLYLYSDLIEGMEKVREQYKTDLKTQLAGYC